MKTQLNIEMHKVTKFAYGIAEKLRRLSSFQFAGSGIRGSSAGGRHSISALCGSGAPSYTSRLIGGSESGRGRVLREGRHIHERGELACVHQRRYEHQQAGDVRWAQYKKYMYK